jgi:hypothetical protein
MFRSLIRSTLSESLGGWKGNQPGLAYSHLLENLVALDRGERREVSDCVLNGEDEYILMK